jgi:hypothetical protein
VFALLVGVGLGYILATPQPAHPPPDPSPEFGEIVVEQPGQELVVLRVVQSHDGKEIRYVAPAGPEAWRLVLRGGAGPDIHLFAVPVPKSCPRP